MAALAIGLLSSCVGSATPESSTSTASTTSAASTTSTTAPAVSTTTSTATSTTSAGTDLLPLVSADTLLEYLRGLTAIRPYGGWRNSATTGEAEARDFVAGVLGGFPFLQSLGLEVEQEAFAVFAATELWESRLYLTVGGQETGVPADALRGHRHDLAQALRFDSDGVANDAEPNPVTVEGRVVLIGAGGDTGASAEGAFRDAVVFVDYRALNPVSRPRSEATALLAEIIDGGAAGLVLVTDSADGPEAQPGYRAGDGAVAEDLATEARPPILSVRLEDCAPAGITRWEDLDGIEEARLVWDADVSSPGTSGNLVARIPGADPSLAVIVGAHLDGPNTPAALDNGANSAALLEVARVIDESRRQPPVDVYLVWFGSEELGFYGSLSFVDNHQELLDRAVGALSLDAFVAAVPDGTLSLDGWSFGRFGDARLPFPRYLEEAAGAAGITVDEVTDIRSISSDNTSFSGFLPQTGLGFGGLTSGYGHTPYDTWEAAAEQVETIEQVAQVALLAVFAAGQDLPDLWAAPETDGRAVIVGSHTQVGHLSPAAFVELGQALAWEGFDVDAVPYGRAVSAEDLEGASLVIVLPAIDYAGGDGAGVAGEAWAANEVDALVAFVEQGGLLVLTNSASRVVLGRGYDANEDWAQANVLAERFGVVFTGGPWSASGASLGEGHLLTQGVTSLGMIADNGVPFTAPGATVLAEARGQPAVSLLDWGDGGGQVLVLADVGLLGPLAFDPVDNLAFWRNLAGYARNR